LCDHGARGFEDIFVERIILLQADDARAGKVALEVQDIADVGPRQP
jgi:hypothetical protein